MALKLTFDQIDLLKFISENEQSFKLKETAQEDVIKSFQSQIDDLLALESLSLIELEHRGNVENPEINNIQVKRITESGKAALNSFLDENYKIEV